MNPIAQVIDDILNADPQLADILEDAEAFAELAHYLPEHLTDQPDSTNRILAYIARLPVWCSVIMMRRCMQIDPRPSKDGIHTSVSDNTIFVEWANRYKDILLTL